MLPCRQCAYRKDIPGDAHSRCTFKWEDPSLMPKGNSHGIKNGWFMFPFNFDPLWGPDTCLGMSETKDLNKIASDNPLANLMSIMGKRF